VLPTVRRVWEDGTVLPPMDDDWRVARPTKKGAVVRLENVHTGHFIELSPDDINDFAAGYLILTTQLTLTRWHVLQHPLAGPRSGSRVLQLHHSTARRRRLRRGAAARHRRILNVAQPSARGVRFDMKIRDLLRLLQADGWVLSRTRGSHRQFKHPTKPGLVTVAGHEGDDIAKGTLNSVLKQAGLKL
jgi:predicted RNA binding protein YcfA (HicA-like mRNA interferase family)